MNKENLFKVLSVVLGVLLLISVALLISKKASTPLGGSIHNTAESFDAGLKVGGTEVISSSRAISGTTGTFTGAVAVSSSITGKSAVVVNGSSTSTIAIGSSAISTKVGKVCVWNGSEYAVITFSAATPSYATSTTCQ